MATTLLSGLGTLTVAAFAPSIVLAAGCTPDAPGTTGPGAPAPATGVELCGTGPGIAYKATGGDLTVQVVGATITPHGVALTDDGVARNISLLFDTTTGVAGPVTATVAGEDGISAVSSGGNVQVATGSSSAGSLAGAVVTGDNNGIVAGTTGGGSVTVNALNKVTGVNGYGINIAAGTGAVVLNTGTNTGAPVAITTNNPASFFAVQTTGGSSTTVTTHGVLNGGMTVGTSATGLTKVDLNGDVNQNGAHIFGDSVAFNLKSGNISSGQNFSSALEISAVGAVTVNTAVGTDLNTTGFVSTGLSVDSAGGNITGTINSTVEGFSATVVDTTGAGTIDLTYNANQTGFVDGIRQSTQNGSNKLTLGSNVTIDSGPFGIAGLDVTASGSGPVTVVGVVGDKVLSTAGNGINAKSGTGAVTVNYLGDVGDWTNPAAPLAVGGIGIDAETTSAAAINIVAGNVASTGVGIFAQNTGSGDVNVTTTVGTDVSSTNDDGIDAWANGGNVTVTLLDGAVHANRSTFGPSGGLPSGPTGALLSLDPNGVYAKTNGAGTVTVDAQDDIFNNGPGDGIRTEAVDGLTTVKLQAIVSNTLGDGVNASASGNGAIDVQFGTINGHGAAISTTNGNGVVAMQNAISGTQNATIRALAGAIAPTVDVTGGASNFGIAAQISGDNGAATVDLSGALAGGHVTVQGTGGNTGIAAFAFDGNADTFSGSAKVATNAGLAITVGTLAGSGTNNTGVVALSNDGHSGGRIISVSLGDGNIINVGSADGSLNAGVAATASGFGVDGGSPVTIVGGAGESITVNGAIGFGVLAHISAGTTFNAARDASVTFGDAGAGAGIHVVDTAGGPGVGVTVSNATGGNSTVSFGTTAIVVDNGTGVSVSSDDASATGGVGGKVSASLQGSVTAGLDGIDASNASDGGVLVNYGTQNATTQTLTSKTGIGISATDSNAVGNVVVNVGHNNTGSTTIMASTEGVHVTGNGNGTVNLNNNVTIDPDNYGVFVAVAGTAKVTTLNNDVITVDDNVVPGSDDKNYGVFAASALNANTAVNNPSVQVALGTNNIITVKDTSADGQADGGLGVAAINVGTGSGGVSVTAGDGLVINVKGNNAGGIGASTIFGGGTGAGNVTVSTGTGSITVTGGANVTDTAKNFPGSFGIAATTKGAGIATVTSGAAITVSNNAPATNTVIGILGQSSGAGSTSVTANGTVTAFGSGAIGINAISGTSGVTVNVNNVVDASLGRGVVTNSTGGGAINVAAATLTTPAGQIRGLGNAANAVVDITTGVAIVPSSTTTLTNGGLIASDSVGTAAEAADLAIKAVGGNLVVTNAATGTINGRIDASGLTSVVGPPATTFFATVNNTGVWNTTGTSTLSGGADVVNNKLGGTINTLGTTTIDFGAGLDTVNNAGLIKVGGAGAATAAATLSLTGLETFNNSGVIDLHDGVNPANRSLTATGTAFNGSGASLLYVDAFLGAPGSTADTLTVGSTSGLTSIRVNDTNAGVGAFNPTGILVVTGSSAASTFQLSSLSSWFAAGGSGFQDLPVGAVNVLDKPGLFFYDLAFSGNQELLVSAPKVQALQFAQIGAISGDTWYNTTQSWFDRQADLRDTVGAHATGSGPAVWMKITGDWARRDSSQTVSVLNKTYTYDTSYRGNTAAVIAGVDLLNVTDKDKAWVVGVQGGYVDTNERFRNSSTRLNLTGGVVGVYATYIQGGLFVDGIVNGNILTANWNLPGLGVTTAPWVASNHVNTWGGQLEAGYAFPIGANSFIEPVGSIAYGRTTNGQLTLPLGNTETIANSDTLRGSLGARVGTTAAFQYYKVKVALEGRAWDEFDGKTTTVLGNGGTSFTNLNNISGVYGEIKGEANIFAVGNNLSAFVNTGIKWKARYQDTSVTLGVRYQW